MSGRSVSLVLGLLNIALAAAFVIADAAPENGRKFATDELASPLRLFVGHDAIDCMRKRRRRGSN